MRRTLCGMVLVLVAASCAFSSEGGADRPAQSACPSPVAMQRDAGEPFRFVAIGDFGSGSSHQRAVADRMAAWRTDHPFDLVVTTGDNVYETGHPDRFNAVFFRPYACLLDQGVRFRATLGNHDIATDNGRPELEEPAFGMKARNYVVRKGGVRFVMADSNDLRLGWLDENLKPRKGDRWTIAVFHHPVFSSGAHGSTLDLRPALPRLLKKRGVDLVLNGHDHNYEATKKIGGIRYAITGGGGAYLRPCAAPAWFTDTCTARYHFLYVTAGSERIKVQAVGTGGRVFHTFRTRGRT